MYRRQTPNHDRRRRGLQTFAAIALTVGLVAVVACGGGGSDPASPSASPLVLASASVRVDGTPVGNGQTFHHGQGPAGASTLFEARLERDGVPVTGETVFCDYDGPGMGGMHHQGRFGLYDDGTHGDPVAGDGLYCLQDFGGEYGFHHRGAAHGRYHYDFYGQGRQGGQTNHRVIEITVAD